MIRKFNIFSFASITLLLLFFASCRSSKYVDPGEALVTDIDIEGLLPDFKENAYAYVATEIRPNSRLNLTLYNLFNTKDGRYKTQNTRKLGEAPHLLDSSLVELSNKQINNYLFSKGYFQAQVVPKVRVRHKKAHILFDANMGEPYLIDQINYAIADSAIAEIYRQEVQPNSTLQLGRRYDVADLVAERELLYVKLRERGYYDYLRQYMRVEVDTSKRPNRAALTIEVQNPTLSDHHQAYTIDSVYVSILRPEAALVAAQVPPQLDSTLHIVYQDHGAGYKLSPLARYMYVRAGDTYNLRQENLSYDRLFEMNGFRSVKIDYEKVDSTRLNARYELLARPVMGNQIEGEYTFSSGMSGFNIGNTFSHRNIFGGAEQLDIKVRYGVLFDPRLPGPLKNKIFNNDIQVGVNLIVPRLMTPFAIEAVGTYGLPRTTFSSNLQLFNQDNTYQNRYLTNTLNYSWYSSPHSTHSFTPIALEYRVGKLNDDFANQLIDEGYLLYVRSNNRQYFGLGSQYSYTYKAMQLSTLTDFSFFRGSIDISGNTLGLASSVFNFKQNNEGERMLFGVPYLQYAKGEVDYRMYRHLGGHQQFVWRLNAGVAVPYGNNSSLLIFEKSFFSGGMNGIRAWQARTLGPGNYNRADMSENLRLNLRNLDQLGEVKFETNVEYRFRLLNNFLGAQLNGATFIDAGNIWRLKENELNPGGSLQLNKFFSQIAIGTGFGLRFDMDYFVIRLDAGLKIKDPQFQGSDQWVIQHFGNSKNFKDSYYQSHKPDRYNFVQYNFGVGLPF